MASIDRLARSLVDLRGLIDEITGKGAAVEFLSEGLTFSPGVSDPRSTLLLGVLGSFAEFERAIFRERQAEGIALAKKAGRYKGRQRALTPEQSNEIRKQAKAGARPTELAKAFGVSRSTIYRELQKEANMTFLNILGYIFWLGAAAILITKVRKSGIIAGPILSILPIGGLAISLTVVAALGGVLAGTANQFEKEMQSPPATPQLVDSPSDVIDHMLSIANTTAPEPEGY